MADLEWFESALRDIQRYAAMNNLKELEGALAKARLVAAGEVADLSERRLSECEHMCEPKH